MQGATAGQMSFGPSTEQPERLAPLDEEVDHVQGPGSARLILEYGDYECPYSRRAYRLIQRLERRLGIRFAFRHFPLPALHPHALAASCAADAAAMRGRYWDMYEILFHCQKALEDEDLRAYAAELGLDLARFERDWVGAVVLQRIERDVCRGIASGEVRGHADPVHRRPPVPRVIRSSGDHGGTGWLSRFHAASGARMRTREISGACTRQHLQTDCRDELVAGDVDPALRTEAG